MFDTTVRRDRGIELDPEPRPTRSPSTTSSTSPGTRDTTTALTFHRVIEDFVIQGGDPTGDPPGTGGPGYTIDRGGPRARRVPARRRSSWPSGTRHRPPVAQFFIVTGPDGEALPNQYSLFGQVTEGLDVATAIQSVETAVGDQPIEDVDHQLGHHHPEPDGRLARRPVAGRAATSAQRPTDGHGPTDARSERVPPGPIPNRFRSVIISPDLPELRAPGTSRVEVVTDPGDATAARPARLATAPPAGVGRSAPGRGVAAVGAEGPGQVAASSDRLDRPQHGDRPPRPGRRHRSR